MALAVTVRVPARAGLAGNPGDAYGGRVVACTLPGMAATVTARPGEPPAPDEAGGLLAAAMEVLAAASGRDPARVTLRWSTTIPREVGLAGSSALVIGALRAAGALLGWEPPPTVLARLALEAEVEGLGIAAGPMDRVVQAIGGCLHVDCREPWRVTPLRLPPPLLLAWRPEGGEPSGRVHGELRRRAAAHPTRAVQRVIDQLSAAADRAAAALVRGDREALADAMDESFDLRCSLGIAAEADRAGALLAREHGAGVNQAGSGGALVALPRLPEAATPVAAALRAAGWEVTEVAAPGAPLPAD